MIMVLPMNILTRTMNT